MRGFDISSAIWDEIGEECIGIELRLNWDGGWTGRCFKFSRRAMELSIQPTTHFQMIFCNIYIPESCYYAVSNINWQCPDFDNSACAYVEYKIIYAQNNNTNPMFLLFLIKHHCVIRSQEMHHQQEQRGSFGIGIKWGYGLFYGQ